MRTWRELLDHPGPLPDDRGLPCDDGIPAQSCQESPQRQLLTSCLYGHWKDQPPFGTTYILSGNTGIYWRLPEAPEPLIHGAIDPDWFLFPGVSSKPGGRRRRSTVLCQEKIVPRVVMEFTLDDDLAPYDATPGSGKWWIYEQAIGVEFHAIYGMETASLECFRLEEGRYQPIAANSRGHFPVPSLPLEPGLWQGHYDAYELQWLRWWTDEGALLPTAEERIQQYRRQARAEQYRQIADQHRQLKETQARIARLAERLRALGIIPDELE
jgi:hypothetical protein